MVLVLEPMRPVLNGAILRVRNKEMKTALTIAGSDSSGGAGIQADIKTMMANGVYAMSAITALTAQNTTGVRSIMNVTPGFLADELDMVFTDIFPDAVKVGMVSQSPLIHVIAGKLQQYRPRFVVVDTVMVASSGAKLLDDDAVQVLKEELLPLATVITPNIPEAEVLSGIKITGAADMTAAARQISRTYGCAVLCKGGHSRGNADDLLWHQDGSYRWFKGDRINNPNTHGTGCTLSSAIASNLAKGFDLDTSVEKAKEYVSGALSAMLDLGHGSGPMDHSASENRSRWHIHGIRPELLRLYAVTDRRWLHGRTLEEVLEEALRGGVTMVQLREKGLPEEELYEEALRLKPLCRKYHVPLLVDDSVSVCRLADLDGVHVGQEDMAVTKAREILGPDKIIGATAHNIQEAVRAEAMGADYLGCGAAFSTDTKKDAHTIDRREYAAITSAVSIPVCAIGGITEKNAVQLRGYGLSGLAVVSGIFASPDITASCRSLRTVLDDREDQ